MATIAFFPEGAFGPTNNCVGIGDVLRSRGHDVVFIVEESFAGNLEAKGFEERLMRLGPPPEEPEEPGQFWKDYIRDTAPVFRKPTIEQLEGFVAPTFEALVEGARYVDNRLANIIADLEPDVIVEDNVVTFPALIASRRPWVRIVSCNPAELKDPAVPPPFSGYPTSDQAGWKEYAAEYRRTMGELQGRFDAFCRDRGAPPLGELEFIHESPWANLYFYPSEVDYSRERRLGDRWVNLETSVRNTDEPWQPPLGFITGEEFLPQTKILPLVDVVVTHGGNNTVTECFLFGRPMVVLPLFWDQYDNAQRVAETGFGIRLDTYGHEPEELIGAIERLLADAPLRAHMEAASVRLQQKPGTVVAADTIERLATS